MKPFKSRAFKDRLKGHKDAIIKLSAPHGPNSSLLLSASKDGNIRGLYKFYLRHFFFKKIYIKKNY